MWEILSENEKLWITMNENNSGMTVHFKLFQSHIDEDYWVELPYAEWRNLLRIARQAKCFSEQQAGVGIGEGEIAAEWLARDCIQLNVGKNVGRYFTPETWEKFTLLLDQAAQKIPEV